VEDSTPSQIWPHLTVLVLTSLLRYAASAIQTIRPADAEAQFGNRISCSRNEGIPMRKFLFALSLLSIAVSSEAFAQQQRSGTPEEQKACARDVQRFCRPVIDQGDFTILACLQQNRPKITPACDQVLKNHGQ
jgi:hypothetical protein